MSLFELTGLDEFENQLDQELESVDKLSGLEQISLEELFPTSFMQKYTSFQSLEELFSSGNFKIESEEDLESISPELDKYIASNTSFNSWEDMLDEANSQFFERLGF